MKKKGKSLLRPSLATILARAIRLRCPRCSGGKLFRGYLKMYDGCPSCKLKYERAPGYFLGSTYINYGLTNLTLTTAYVLLHFFAGYENRTLTVPLLAYVVLFPMFFFRYARAFWLSLDCFLDRTGWEQNQD